MRINDSDQKPSPTRLLEMLSDRFGAFEAIANSSIKLARVAPEEELAMDVLVAEAVLEFADDLRSARTAAITWTAASQAIPPNRVANTTGGSRELRRPAQPVLVRQ